MASPPRPWIDRRAALAAALLLAAAVALSLLAAAYDTFPLDERWAAWVRGWGDGFEPVADLLNAYNLAIAVAAWMAALGLALARRRPDLVALVALALSLRLLLLPLKGLVDRPRPEGDFPLLAEVSGGSFPSGHVLTVAAAAGLWLLLAQLLPPRLVWPARALALAFVALSALGRVWAGVHWPSDTYGAAIWSAATLALLLSLRPALRRLLASAARD